MKKGENKNKNCSNGRAPTLNNANTGQDTHIAMDNNASNTNSTSNTNRNSKPFKNPSSGQKKPETKNISWLHRPCLWVAEGIKWLPVAFISAVISWSYYAFVGKCINIDSILESFQDF